LFLYAASGVCHAGLINGGFESGTTGWTATGNMAVISSQGETEGVSALAFSFGNVPSNGVLSQTFATSIGQTYEVTFDFGKFSIFQPLQFARLDVDVFDGAGFGSLQLLDATVMDGTPGSSDPNSVDSPSVYSSFLFSFVATGVSSTLRFTDLSDPQVSNGGGFDAMLDNVGVNAVAEVPEPASLTLFALGALGPFRAVRRRSATC